MGRSGMVIEPGFDAHELLSEYSLCGRRLPQPGKSNFSKLGIRWTLASGQSVIGSE